MYRKSLGKIRSDVLLGCMSIMFQINYVNEELMSEK